MSNTMHAAVDIDALLDEASLPERTIQVCLRGDLYAQWEILNRDLEKSAESDGLGQSPETAALQEQIAEVEAKMEASTLTLRLRAVAKPDADKIILDNPARDENKTDQQVGFNIEAVEVATIRACLADPQLDDAQWGKFAKVLTAAQWRSIMQACDALNYSALDLPFLLTASGRRPA